MFDPNAPISLTSAEFVELTEAEEIEQHGMTSEQYWEALAIAEESPEPSIIRLIVAGGRDFNDRALMCDELHKFLPGITLAALVLICGEARGADSLGKSIMQQLGVPIESYPAEWDRLGKSAGYTRNTDMANVATHLIAFWDGKSKGTKHMIDIAQRKNLFIHIVKY